MKLTDFVRPEPTIDAMRESIEERERAQPERGYLGMSSIGDSCDAKLWYWFRFAGHNNFDATTLAKFEDGHRTEDLMAARLRRIPGIELSTHDEATGEQHRYSLHGGHFSGGMDGVGRGFLEAPKTWHVWEHKASEKGPTELAKAKAEVGEKSALAKWHPKYYAQAVMYMDVAGLDRHYLTVSSAGGRFPITSCRTEANPEYAEQLKARALKIIKSTGPMQRVNENPSWYECSYCPVRTVCRGDEPPRATCRTCVHATPELDGNARWSCAKHKRDLTLAEQLAACNDHVYIPDLLTNAGFEFIDANEELNYALYQVGPYTVGNGTPRELDEGGSVRVLESYQWQHLPRRGAELTLDAIYTLGATLTGHVLGDPPPVEVKEVEKTNTSGKDAIKLLSQKQLRAMTANAGAVAKATVVKGKKIANVYGINGELLA